MNAAAPASATAATVRVVVVRVARSRVPALPGGGARATSSVSIPSGQAPPGVADRVA